MAFFVRRVGTRAEAEDLTQETFARLAAGGNKGVRHANAYVFQAAANLLRDRARRQKVRANYQAASSGAASPEDLLSPERVLASRETLDCVSAALHELPERTRAIFILYRLENLKKSEIASLLAISVSGVDKHLVKAMAHLHARLMEAQ